MSGPPGATGPTGDWEKLYATSDVAALPWYSPDLDADIEHALKAHRLKGARILDLGTGPATQAMNLAKRGFDVVGTDISGSAIKKAKESAKEAGLSIAFLVDNVLKSRLAPNLVDVIVDRGVFHVMPKDKRPVYVQTVHRVLRSNGWLFLKCFSIKEPGTWGPFRLAEPELLGYFRGPFEIRSVVETVFQGNVKPPPKALFATFRRRDSAISESRSRKGDQKRARKRSTRS
jgi:cyclopropane fatty-acyl-phospholipid synthase-like methyltransferase